MKAPHGKSTGPWISRETVDLKDIKMPVIEIRSYKLKPNSRNQFHQLVIQQSLPLMLESGIDVVDFGPSLGDSDSYFLIRAFENLKVLETSQTAFYESQAWRNGPREAIVNLIVSDHNLLFELSLDRLEAFRNRSVCC